jgi:polar amino acid transport system substrate-binding protein
MIARRSLLLAAGATAFHRIARGAGKKTYVVGSTATGVPFSFLDVKTNTLTGAMVDIVKAVAADADFQIDLRVTAFAALIPSLTSGKIDIISAAMLKTTAREKVVGFSDPVYSYGAGLVVPAQDKKDYQRIQDLRGMTAGVQVGTRFFDQMQAAGAKELKTYDTLMDMLRDLSLGRINAAYGDAPILAYEVSHAKTPNMRFVKSFQAPAVEECCLVLRKSDAELVGRINTSVKRIKTTKIKAVTDRWGLS